MTVRWRARREPPEPADDGRWGVARLVAQREAERRAGVPPQPRPPADTRVPSDPADAAAGSPDDRPAPVPDGPDREYADRPAAVPGGPDRAAGGSPRSGGPEPERPASDSSEPGPTAASTAGGNPAGPARPPVRPVLRPTNRSVVYRPPAVSARPRIEPEPGLVGFSRLTRGRTGARVFMLVFAAIYLVIAIQTLLSII